MLSSSENRGFCQLNLGLSEISLKPLAFWIFFKWLKKHKSFKASFVMPSYTLPHSTANSLPYMLYVLYLTIATKL